MDINTRAYEAYARLIKGYNSNNIALGYDHESNKLFVNGAISLAYVSAPNPFLAGSKEGHLYYRMRYCYGMWQRGGIDAKVNRRRMLDAAAK